MPRTQSIPFASRRSTLWLGLAMVCALAGTAWMYATAHAAEGATAIPAAAVDDAKAAGPTRVAVFSGGCFWGVQGVFEHVRGVKQVLAGYSGGAQATAHYEMVSTGTTGHAESVQVTYDPAEVTYGELLRVFFSVAHDPTELDRQGPDVGNQYRSEVFYANADQQRIASAYIAQLDQAHAFPSKIVTRMDPLKGFYRAEEYHQDFLVKNPTYPYIVYNDLPKIANFRSVLPALYQGSPVLIAAVR